MPNLRLLGHEWDTCSDMLPVNLMLPIIFYSCWILPLAVFTYLPREAECYTKPGHTHYRVGELVIFTAFCAQLLCEMVTATLALRGTPLQTRKRWLAERCLLLGYVINLVQLGGTIFGSWVLATFTAVPCRNDQSLRPLVISSWILLALSLLWTLLCLRWFPRQQGTVEAWVKRLRCLCAMCACLGFRAALEPLRKLDLADAGDDPDAPKREGLLVEHLAETFSVIFGDVSFTHSDRHAALVLASALQQKRRHERIRQQLAPHVQEAEAALPAKKHRRRPSANLEHSITLKYPAVVTPSSYGTKVCPQLGAQAAADAYTGHADRVDAATLEEALGMFEYAVAAYYVLDSGLQQGGEGGAGEQPPPEKPDNILEAAVQGLAAIPTPTHDKHKVSVQEQDGQTVDVALPQDTERLVERGMSVTAGKAVKGELQRGKPEQQQQQQQQQQQGPESGGGSAPAADAAAPQGQGARVAGGAAAKVVTEDGEAKVASSRCGMCRRAAPVLTPLDKLDCVFSRGDNTLLGALPYMIALDHERKTVVLGVRGTSSLSDAITDALAQPMPVLPWLGEVIQEPDGELAAVHSGILASAAALHHDLEEHSVLTALFSGAAVDPNSWRAFQAELGARAPGVGEGEDGAASLAGSTAALVGTAAAGAAGDVPLEAKQALVAETPFGTGSIVRLAKEHGIELKPTEPAPAPAPPAGLHPVPEPEPQPALASPFAPATALDPVPEPQPALASVSAPAATAPATAGARRTQSVELAPATRVASIMQGRQLMARDEDVIASARQARQAEWQRNEDARRSFALARRSPSRRHMQRPGGGERSGELRSASMRNLFRSRTPAREGAARQASLTSERSRNSADARLVAAEEGRRRQSLTAVQGQQLEQAIADARAAALRSGPAASPPGERDALQGAPSGDRPLPRGGRRSSLDRGASVKHPFVSAGRAVKKLYSDARDRLEGERGSPHASPRRQRPGAASGPGRGGQRQGQGREEMLAKVEAQMTRTFLPKIFRKQQDLLALESTALEAEQQRRRTAHRAQQLERLQERRLDCRGWSLVLTGHSLGAGVAALLALKLRNRWEGVPVRCWAFCPPGALATLGLSRHMASFCTSVVVAKDGVPRASLGNLSRLVDEMVTGLARGRRCKAHVLLRNLSAGGRAKFRRPGEFYDVEELPEQPLEVLQEYAAGAAKRREAIGQPVFPPGRTIFCRRLKESALEAAWDAVWVPPEDIINEGFLISSKMLKDHLCDTVTQALEMSIDRLKSPPPAGRLPGPVTSPDSSDADTDEEE